MTISRHQLDGRGIAGFAPTQAIWDGESQISMGRFSRVTNSRRTADLGYSPLVFTTLTDSNGQSHSQELGHSG